MDVEDKMFLLTCVKLTLNFTCLVCGALLIVEESSNGIIIGIIIGLCGLFNLIITALE